MGNIKGVTKASKKLPENCRESFINMFKCTGLIDLYDGDLESYFNIIATALCDKNRRIKGLETIIAKIGDYATGKESVQIDSPTVTGLFRVYDSDQKKKNSSNKE